MLGTWLNANLFSYMLVFSRVGAAIMVMPGLGEALVMRRSRLLLALLITVLVTPVVSSELPPPPSSPLGLTAMTFGETLIGMMIGLMARLLLTAVDTAGTIIALLLGLSNAQVFNPAMATQGTIVNTFMVMVALVLIFTANLHHLLIAATVDSYAVFRPGVLPDLGDAANVVTRLVAHSFELGAQIAAPIVLVGMILVLSMGLMARLMPQIQIFFVAAPVQIVFGLSMVAFTLSAMMLFWLDSFRDGLAGLLRPG